MRGGKRGCRIWHGLTINGFIWGLDWRGDTEALLTFRARDLGSSFMIWRFEHAFAGWTCEADHERTQVDGASPSCFVMVGTLIIPPRKALQSKENVTVFRGLSGYNKSGDD